MNRLLILLIFCLSGCVSIDSQSWKEEIDSDRTKSLSGSFYNQASYRTQGLFVAEENFANLIKAPHAGADFVDITLSAKGLLIRFSESDSDFVISFKDGLSIEENGVILLPDDGGFASGGGAVVYSSHSIALFVNKKGNLVALQSGGGVGLFGPFPIGVFAKQVSIFNSKVGTNAPP